MASPTLLPPKKDVARGLLLRGTVFVHLDPRRDGVAIPAWLRAQPQVVLQVGLDMPVPIPDLRVDDTGVYATLSFQRTPFTCTVPWEAVFALVGDDGKGMVWPDDLPPEIAAEVEREAHRHRDEEQKAKPEKRGPSRRADSGGPRVPASLRRSGNGNGADDRPAAPMAAPALAAGLEPSGSSSDGDDDAEVSRASPRRPASRAAGAAGTKKKRRVELPPYLRVIK